MKKLFFLLIFWFSTSYGYCQFITSYKMCDISDKISYRLGWYAKKGLVLAYDSTSYMQSKDKGQRKMTMRVVRKFTENGVEEYRFPPLEGHKLDSQSVNKFLRYPKQEKYSYYKFQKGNDSLAAPIQVHYHEFGHSTNVLISTGWQTQPLDTAKELTWKTGNFKTNPNPILGPRHPLTPYSNKQLRDIFRTYTEPKVFYMEISSMPGVGGRTLQVINREPNLEKYSQREQKEISIFSYGAFHKFGFDIDGRNSFYVSYAYLHQGFRADGHSVTWENGLSHNSSPRRYNFDYHGFEAGYSFNPFKENTAFSSDIGLHFLIAPNAPSTNNFSWGPHFSMGPKFRLGGRLDLRILPTGYLNVRRLETGAQTMEVATRLYTIGIKFAVRQYF